jgi:hypothetical protein
MAKQPEARLQKKMREQLQEELGGFWFKVWGGPLQQRGIPDLIGCVEGLFFAIEVKYGRGRPSEIQVETIKRIQVYGKGCSFIAWDIPSAIEAVRDHLEQAGRLPATGSRVRPVKEARPHPVQTRDRKNVDSIVGLRKPRDGLRPKPQRNRSRSTDE